MSRRWRSLTKRHIPLSLSSTEDVLNQFVQQLRNVFIIAGILDPFADVHGGNAVKLLTPIVQRALRVKEDIGFGVQSSDMVLQYAVPGTVFNPSLLQSEEDIGSSNWDHSSMHIVGTAALGLIRRATGKEEEKELPILKARVVLPSELADALEG